MTGEQVLLTTDSRRRVTLNRLGVTAPERYSAQVDEDGTVTLTPVDVVERSR